MELPRVRESFTEAGVAGARIVFSEKVAELRDARELHSSSLCTSPLHLILAKLLDHRIWCLISLGRVSPPYLEAVDRRSVPP